MNTARRWAITIIAALSIAGAASADVVGLGLTLSDDFPNVPDKEEVYSRLFGSAEIVPGFLVSFREYDWGMSFDFGFDFYTEDPVVDPANPWWMDFDFTATYDWHLLPRFIVDPFFQIGAGMNMAARLVEDEDPEEVLLGFHPVIGGGINVVIGNLFLRGALQYQGLLFPVPSSQVDPYRSGPYRVVLAAGLNFH